MPALLQELLEQQAGPRIGIAVDEADRRVEQSLDRSDAERIAAPHHQPHLARHEGDHAIEARRQPALGRGDARLAQLALRQMHAGQIAAVMRERDQRCLVADIAEIDADAGLAAQQLAQLGHGEAMARVHADDRRAVRQELVDLGLQLLREVLELRLEARLKALPGPHQLVAERRQAWCRGPAGARPEAPRRRPTISRSGSRRDGRRSARARRRR